MSEDSAHGRVEAGEEQTSEHAARTLSEVIRNGLSDEITSGRLAAGTQIDELEVAARFNVSRTPVREALRELAAAGLVSIEPRRGVRVTAVTLHELGELFELAAETEALCVRLATYRMHSEERLRLQTLHRDAAPVAQAGDVDRYDALNRDFHRVIHQGSHNKALADHAAALRIRLSPFRRAQFHNVRRIAESHAEHGEILRHVLRGDGSEAERAMRAHVLTASMVLADYIGEPDPGAIRRRHRHRSG